MVPPVGAPSRGLPVASRSARSTSMMVLDFQARRIDPRRAHLLRRRPPSADERRRLAHLRVPFLDGSFEPGCATGTVALAKGWQVRR